MVKDLVSIIIPVYNAEAWIQRCLESVLAQSYPRIEVITVCDGASDGSEDILRAFQARDPRVRLICQSNQGVSAARNHGLSLARGDWICFIDADDYVHPDYVKTMLEAAHAYQADSVAINFFMELPGGCRLPYPFVPARKQLSGQEAVQKTFSMLFFPSFVWNKLFRRSLFTDQAIRFPSILYEDALVVPLLFLNCRRVIALKQARYHYVRQPGSLTHQFSFVHVKDYLTAANMLRHHFWRTGDWELWAKDYGRWLDRIMIQILLSLYLSKGALSARDRKILVQQSRDNIRAMKEAPGPDDRQETLPCPLGRPIP